MTVPALVDRLPVDSATRTRSADPEVLLVNPSAGGAYRAFDFTMAPLGVLTVAAYAEREGHRVAVDDRSVARRGEPFDPTGYDIVGVHCDSTRYHRAIALARD